MTKTIEISDETWEKIKDTVQAESKPKKGVTIYKTNGDVLFESTKDTLREAVLEKYSTGAYLSDADLSYAYLHDADLRGADLSYADLSYANLSCADLRGADLHDADLRGADLSGADLSGADFWQTKFYGKGGTTKIRKSQVDDFFKALGVIVED